MVAGWGDSGTIDLLDWFAELTIYTSSACLIGNKFRNELDSTVRAAVPRPRTRNRRDRLRRPVRADRELPRRDEARLKLVALVGEIMERRAS